MVVEWPKSLHNWPLGYSGLGTQRTKDIIVTEQPPRAVGRRHLLGVSISTAGFFLLKRVLLIYREGLRRLQAGEELPAPSAQRRARRLFGALSRTITSNWKSSTCFPNCSRCSNWPTSAPCCVPNTQRGRVLTYRVLAATGAAPALDQAKRDALAQDVSAFIRMYEPHEAREDTVVFPTLRQVVPAKEFREMADLFEDEEHRRPGSEGSSTKSPISKRALGIYDLSQFTPS